MDGLDVGFGYGEIANANQNTVNGTSDTDEHMVAYATYAMGGVTVGYTEAVISKNTAGGTSKKLKVGVLQLRNGRTIVSYGEKQNIKKLLQLT